MNRIFTTMAALLLGLLFCCTKVYACEPENLPKAGVQGFIEGIEIESVKPKTTGILPSYILMDEDVDLLLRIGVLEAGCDGVDGIANVMQVVLNRVFESDDFPGSIREVIFQTGQFCTADRLATANITPEAWEALDCVIFGDYRFNEALYFESLPGQVWSNVHDYQFTYGGHDFYK